ncbi:MAG: hypothetical protein IMW91_03435 [Firmicutes bacterium]|nr:hypothetical protein [Bacillota bacterium]
MSLRLALFAPNSPTLIGDIGVDHQASIHALRQLSEQLYGIEAVLTVSPHFVTPHTFAIDIRPQIPQIFDFFGFPESFYQVSYTPPGHPALAQELLGLAQKHSLPLLSTDQWGLDHGAWSALLHLAPQATIPVIPLSIAPDLGPAAHEQLGHLISQLAQNHELALICTGSIIHRLDLFQMGRTAPPQAYEYLEQVKKAWKAGSWQSLWAIPERLRQAAAPEGGEAPLRVLAGAIGEPFSVQILVEEEDFGAASMTIALFTPASTRTS